VGEKGLVQGLWVISIPIYVLEATERLPLFIWVPEFNFIYLLLLNLLTKIKNMKKTILTLAIAFSLISCGNNAVTEEVKTDSTQVDSVAIQVDSEAITAIDTTVAHIPAEVK
jgi:hypothetical protein